MKPVGEAPAGGAVLLTFWRGAATTNEVDVIRPLLVMPEWPPVSEITVAEITPWQRAALYAWDPQAGEWRRVQVELLP